MRSKSFIAVAALVAVLLVAAGAVYAYDSGREDQIAQGVSIGAVDVGGMSAATARSTLKARLAAPLRKPVVARYRKHRYTLTVKAAKVSVDVDGSVRDAVARSRAGNILERTYRGLSGGKVNAALDPEIDYDHRAVKRVVARVQDGLERKPVDAKVSFDGGRVDKRVDHMGTQVRASTLRRELAEALVSPTASRKVRVHVKHLKPEVTESELDKKYPAVVIVNRGGFQLSLYKHLKMAKSYRIAVGRAGLETPQGLYKIQTKEVDPVWHVPDSDWAGSLAGRDIPPGPQDPLKARWMGIYNGAGIHGTDEIGSLGSAASHGCIRMAIPDVIDLFDQVDVGTPVYVL